MTCLLDVNALLALAVQKHEFHKRAAVWAKRVTTRQQVVLATSAITELGFLRVLSQIPAYGIAIPQAKSLLTELKAATRPTFAFLPDAQGIDALPSWVKGPKQITDGHLVELGDRTEQRSQHWTNTSQAHC